MRKYIAEALGAYGLTLAVLVAIATAGANTVPVPVIAGLTLALFVYSIGPISGAHINPAISIGLFMINKLSPKDLVIYILAQFAGAYLALYSAGYLNLTFPTMAVENTVRVGLGEALGALFFSFGVAAVATGRVSQRMGGLVVGGSLLLGITIASAVSNGILNPAVALGLGSLNIAYAAAPIVGAIVGMKLFTFLMVKERT